MTRHNIESLAQSLLDVSPVRSAAGRDGARFADHCPALANGAAMDWQPLGAELFRLESLGTSTFVQYPAHFAFTLRTM
jgi:hypothetical protein